MCRILSLVSNQPPPLLVRLFRDRGTTRRAAAAVALFLGGWGTSGADLVRLTENQQSAFGIELAAPQPAGEAYGRRYPGKVAVPNRQLRVVSAPQGGVLAALLVAEGETVREGEVMAQLRSPELLELQGSYLEARTRETLAASELARDRKLQAEGIIAERRLLESRARYQEASTQAAQYRQRLELSGMSTQDIAELARTRRLTSTLPLRAPIEGVVLEQLVSTGQAVAAADALFRVGRLAPLWLEIHLPVDRVATVREGDRVVLPREELEGRVITIGSMVHTADQGVLVRAEVATPAGLRPGQFVEVQLAEQAAGNAWRVPDVAVLRSAGKKYVFVARRDGFEPVEVELTASEERHAIVAGTLKADDRIAVSGVVALKAAWLGGSE